MKKLSIIILLSMFALAGCPEATTNPNIYNPDEKQPIFKISGRINNPNNIDIPDDSKLVLVWYKFFQVDPWKFVSHQGNFNKADLTFEIEIDKFPKDSCLNLPASTKVGIAHILLVGKHFPIGKWAVNENPTKFSILGIVRDKAVIATSGTLKKDLKEAYGWASNFNNGVQLGHAIYQDEFLAGFALSDMDNALDMTLIEDLEQGENIFPEWLYF